MGLVIKDLGVSISIIRDEVPLYVVKRHIKTLDTVGTDVLRINIGEGPLRSIYINKLELDEPQIKNIFELLDYFNNMIQKAA